MISGSVRRQVALLIVFVGVGCVSGCGWRGLNSLPLPGTQGQGAGSYQVQAQLPDVTNIQPNSRVRVGDVTVGTVTKIERQGWHALLTMKLDSNVELPANSTVKIGQTSVLGSLHIELAPPVDIPPEGRLHNGSLIPLAHAGTYPTTEQTLAVASMFLNGGGLGQIQDITKAFATAFTGRADDLRSLIKQLDEFIGHLDQQKVDIIAATDSLERVTGQFGDHKPIIDEALHTIPAALSMLKDHRDSLVQAFDRLGKFNALAATSAEQTKKSLAEELKDLGSVLDSLANAGPALTRSLSLLSTYPWPKENITKFFRGDAMNISMIVDMTLSRLDTSMFTGTRWEGNLTELEMQWGRTIGQLPSPATFRNPIVIPYRLDQGP